MRKLITLVEGIDAALFEMPMLSEPVEFEFDDPYQNGEIFQILYGFTQHNGDCKVLERTESYILADHRMMSDEGEVFLLDLIEKAVVFYVRYELSSFPGIGPVASQTMLWRKPGSIYPTIASRVFMDYLLRKTGCIISDAIQTPDGKRFWERRMAEAAKHGWVVGLIDMANRMRVYRGKETFEQWLTKFHAWDAMDDFQDLRYFIVPKPFATWKVQSDQDTSSKAKAA